MANTHRDDTVGDMVFALGTVELGLRQRVVTVRAGC